jgi:hypothetical protein
MAQRLHSPWSRRTYQQEESVRKLILSGLFAFAVGIGGVQAADIVVKIAPPRAVVEHREARPSPQHVWIAGYHRWDGNNYAWEKGRWEVPPRANAVWIAPRWTHRKDGYVFAEGRWK